VLVLSVDWFIGIARALGNLIGNCVATVVVAAWEKDIDRERAHGVLNGTIEATDLDAGLAAMAEGGVGTAAPVAVPATVPGR
jgi:aerobic C4-dicarboxylate transport protein